MYLAGFCINGRDYVQAAFRLAFTPVGASTEVSCPWRQHASAIARTLVGLSPEWCAVKFDLRGGFLSRHLIVTVEASRAGAMRRWATALSRLEREASGSVSLMRDAAAHDVALSRPEGSQVAFRGPVLRAAGVSWTEPSFRMFEMLDVLLERAWMEGADLCCQAIITPRSAAPEDVRTLRRAALKLSSIPGFGARRKASFDGVVAAYVGASYALHEAAWFPSADVPTWFEEAVAGARVQACLSSPSLVQVRPAIDEGAFAITPGDADADVCANAAAATEPDTLAALLSWSLPETSPIVAERARPNVDTDRGSAPAVPVESGEDFIFISYARSDTPLLTPVLEAWTAGAIPFWYDRNHRAGEAWLSSIERRIERCRAFVLLLSPASAASRYVQAELTFAYTIDKPIMPVLLTPTSIPEGMRLILANLQIVPVADLGLPDHLRTGFGRGRP